MIIQEWKDSFFNVEMCWRDLLRFQTICIFYIWRIRGILLRRKNAKRIRVESAIRGLKTRYACFRSHCVGGPTALSKRLREHGGRSPSNFSSV